MATVLNTIYPPQVATFMPSFRYDKPAEIWFDISSYNDDLINSIRFIHVSMVDQRNNQSVFAGLDGANLVYPQYYPIKCFNGNKTIKDLYWDKDKQLYKITVPPQLLKTTPFYNAGQYYKVQLRFDLTGATGYPAQSGYSDPTTYFYWTDSNHHAAKALSLASYTTANQDNFSEWSTGTLIKAIYIPTPELHFDTKSVVYSLDYYYQNGSMVSINENDKAANENVTFEYLSNVDKENLITDLFSVLPSTDSVVVGKIMFDKAVDDKNKKTKSKDNEWLEWYRITTWDNKKTICYYDSGKIYAEANTHTNEINCRVDMSQLPIGGTNKQYLRLDYETSNGYSFSKYYTFLVADYSNDTNLTYTTDINEDDGIITINVSNLNYNNGYLVVRRASHRTNFIKWDFVGAYDVSSKSTLPIIDNTVESIVGYKYQLQYMNDNAIYRPIIVDITHCDFYGALFSDKDKTLRITFDFNMSNRANAANRTKVDTLGGQYPVFTQNAKLKYHTYSISGRISTEDNGELFLPKEEVFGNEYYNYRYNPSTESPHVAECQAIDPHSDWLYEREYRDAVEDWLNNGKLKLFRSMTEGNMVVMLDGITMTPDTVLGRRLYSFNATMYEMGDGRDIESITSLGLFNAIDER